MKRGIFYCLAVGAALIFVAGAQSKSASASYELLHAPLSGGGGMASNGGAVAVNVRTGDALFGPVTEVTSGGVQEKPNFIGQLYDVFTLSVAGVPATVDEGGTRQLAASAIMGDTTTLVPAATEVQWSVVLGPLAGINGAGLATAGLVYADTSATVQGAYQGTAGQFVLTVLDANTDNFGGYAGDGIDDFWQVGFFGEPPNAEAAPGFDKDGDGADNTTEWLTGFDPLDPFSFFQVSIEGATTPAPTVRLNKVIPERVYTVVAGTSPSVFPETVGVLEPAAEEADKGIIDLSGPAGAKYYRVHVNKP